MATLHKGDNDDDNDLMFFLTVYHSIDFSKYQLSAQFF